MEQRAQKEPGNGDELRRSYGGALYRRAATLQQESSDGNPASIGSGQAGRKWSATSLRPLTQALISYTKSVWPRDNAFNLVKPIVPNPSQNLKPIAEYSTGVLCPQMFECSDRRLLSHTQSCLYALLLRTRSSNVRQ